MPYLDCRINTDKDGEPIDIENPSNWSIRQILEKKCVDMVCNGPGGNYVASIRLMKIMDAVESIDAGKDLVCIDDIE